jgi:hypothetical protein
MSVGWLEVAMPEIDVASGGVAAGALTQQHYDWASEFCGVNIVPAASFSGPGELASKPKVPVPPDPKAGKVDEATKKVDKLTDAELAKLTSADQVALLREIEGNGKPTGAARSAQIKIFKNMKLDPSFKKREAERADKVADAIKDNAEVKASAKNWAGTSKDQKIKALMEAQCKQLGIPTPPFETYDQAPGKDGTVEDGNYDPSDGKMHFNINAGANKTFNDAMDTIVHETSHAYQQDLVKRLKDGKIKPGDDDYPQAQMFEANDAGQDYIQPTEDMTAYVAQPEENHARVVAADYIDKINSKLTGPKPAPKGS